MERGVYINYHLLAHPLEITVSAKPGSGQQIDVALFDMDQGAAGQVKIILSNPPRFSLGRCVSLVLSSTLVPVSSQVSSVWKITKTGGPGLKIELDGKVVLEILVLGGLCVDYPDSWLDFWGRRVEKIMFLDTDTASLEYISMPGSLSLF